MSTLDALLLLGASAAVLLTLYVILVGYAVYRATETLDGLFEEGETGR